MYHFKRLLSKIPYLKATKYFEKQSISQEVVTKLDFKKLEELLIIHYAEKLLDNLEKELNEAYNQGKLYETGLKLHSREHHMLIDNLQKITKDFEKVKLERSLIEKKGKLNLDKIKQDLGISDYVFKNNQK